MKALTLSVCILLFLIALTACKKRGDFEVPYQIKMITERYRLSESAPVDSVTYTFHYTPWGDPKSIISSRPATGRPNYYFYYDGQRRLIRRKDEFRPGDIEMLVKYQYDSNSIIVSDTTWYGGTDENNTAGFHWFWFNQYFYDSKGRIARMETSGSGGTSGRIYEYDAKGNLIWPGATYDNKVNFLRTNLVLAFINRDYSMNNRVQAVSYNRKGLPNGFVPVFESAITPHFMNIMANEIAYTCERY